MRGGILIPIEVRPDIGAPGAASLTGEARFDVGQLGLVRPPVAADRGPMAAWVVRAIDQEAAYASGAHLSEGDLLAGWFGHRPLKRGTGRQATALRPVDCGLLLPVEPVALNRALAALPDGSLGSLSHGRYCLERLELGTASRNCSFGGRTFYRSMRCHRRPNSKKRGSNPGLSFDA